MARTGSFGRLPRALPTLTSTLLAIAREQEAQRDQNIMDAWKSGGNFEGKPVTDEMMLQHWRNRLDGIAKDDPLYDTYKNAILQTQYSIEESKMTARYALIRDPSAGDDAAMANFYLKWARKVPRNSEFYRVLQRDAGQYLRASKSKSDAAAARAKEEKYVKDMAGFDRKQKPGEFALSIISNLGSQGAGGSGAFLPETSLGGLAGVNGNTNVFQGNSVTSLDQMAWLASQVNAETYMGGPPSQMIDNSNQWLFTDDQGKRWTKGEVRAELLRLDPSFDGDFSMTYVANKLADQAATLKDQIALAQKTGHTTDAARLREKRAVVIEQAESARAWPVLQRYADIKMEIEEIKKDPSLLPPARTSMIEKKLSEIGRLAGDPAIANDGNLQSRLRAESNLVDGTVTVWEDLFGTKGVGMTPGSVIEPDASGTEVGSLKDFLETGAKMVEDVQSGAAIMTQGFYKFDQTVGANVFTPAAGGDQWGTITPEQLAAMPNADKARATLVPNGDGSGSMKAVILPRPIYGTFNDPALKGKVQVEGLKDPIGWAYTYAPNGEKTTSFLVQTPDKGSYLSIDPTLDPKLWATATETQSDYSVDLSKPLLAQLDKASAQNIQGNPAGSAVFVDGVPGLRVEGRSTGAPLAYGEKQVPNGFGGFTTTTDYSKPIYATEGGSPGKIVVNASIFATGTEPTNIAGYQSDRDSPSLVVTASRGMTEGAEFITSVKDTQDFKSIYELDRVVSTGAVPDPATGQMVPPAGREDVWDAYGSSIPSGAKPGTGAGPYSADGTSEGRQHAPGQTAPAAVTQSWDRGWATDSTSTKLPTDRLRDMRDQRFGALYSTMNQGTNVIKPTTSPQMDLFKINVGPGFVLPAAPKSITVPGSTSTGPTGTGAATVPGGTGTATVPGGTVPTQANTRWYGKNIPV